MLPSHYKFHTETFLCTVEGKTEKLYMEWLQKAINQHGKRTCNTKILASVSHPSAFIKQLKIIDRTDIYHIIDREQLTQQSIKTFQTKIDEMRKAEKLGKEVSYRLAYSNMSFELWILLHKTGNPKTVINPEQYKTEINSYFNQKFQKLAEFKEEKNFRFILSMLSINDVISAVKNAELLTNRNAAIHNLQSYKRTSFYNHNPSLSVHEFIKIILKKVGII